MLVRFPIINFLLSAKILTLIPSKTHTVSLRSLLILSSHLGLDLPNHVSSACCLLGMLLEPDD
jgi:hypothetical protein